MGNFSWFSMLLQMHVACFGTLTKRCIVKKVKVEAVLLFLCLKSLLLGELFFFSGLTRTIFLCSIASVFLNKPHPEILVNWRKSYE